MAGEGTRGRKVLWRNVDAMAFGLIYGSVTVLSLLMALGTHPESPLTSSTVLLGSVLAISLAKAFAEQMSNAIDNGERITRSSVAKSWHHTRDTRHTQRRKPADPSPCRGRLRCVEHRNCLEFFPRLLHGAFDAGGSPRGLKGRG